MQLLGALEEAVLLLSITMPNRLAFLDTMKMNVMKMYGSKHRALKDHL
jgi:hypothetical protein